MKKFNVMMATTMLVSILAISSTGYAQTQPTNGAGSDSRTTNAQYDDDKNTNYGWVGLLGLIGLAGFMKRNNDVREARVTNTPKYNS